MTSNVAVRKRIQHLQLTSDIFFNTVLTDIDACKEVVDIITGENLNIVEVRNQQAILRFIDATNKQIPNGISEYYVNLACSGRTQEQTALLQYMVNSDGIEESIYFPNLVKRVRHLKENEGGLKIMCEIIDAIVQEERIEARIEGRLEGRLESKVELIRNLKENFTLSKLANMLGLEETYVGDIVHMITMYPQENDELIVKRLL